MDRSGNVDIPRLGEQWWNGGFKYLRIEKKKRKREGLIILYFSSAVVNLFIESISARENMENVFLGILF